MEKDHKNLYDVVKALMAEGGIDQAQVAKNCRLIRDLIEQSIFPECLFLKSIPVLPAKFRITESMIDAAKLETESKAIRSQDRLIQAIYGRSGFTRGEMKPKETDLGEINNAYLDILRANKNVHEWLNRGYAFQRQIAAMKSDLFKSLSQLFQLPVFADCFWVFYESVPAEVNFRSDLSDCDETIESYRLMLVEIGNTEILSLGKQRVGQNLFRERQIDFWRCCVITGLENTTLLRASHIKPWSACESDIERLDVFNGFLLSPQYDALFDSGLMTFDDSGRILFSGRLLQSDFMALGLQAFENKKITLNPRHLPYLQWHRNYVFKDSENA